MRRVFGWLAGLLLSGTGLLAFADGLERDEGLTLLLPPESLGQWYRPVAKRDQWLHLMFALRRDMQAVAEYSAVGDEERLGKWLDRLERDYRRIGEMVPEWADELELELVAAMRQAESPRALAGLQRKLAQSCEGCHREYRLVTALRYRTPDFDEIRVENPSSGERMGYAPAMARLSSLVNRVRIAAGDGRWSAALDALQVLEAQLPPLRKSCSGCHEDPAPVARILGDAASAALAGVREGLAARDPRAAGRHLGEFAVNACARCHAVHRPLAELRRLLKKVEKKS